MTKKIMYIACDHKGMEPMPKRDSVYRVENTCKALKAIHHQNKQFKVLFSRNFQQDTVYLNQVLQL